MKKPLDAGLHSLVETQLERIDARAINTLPIGQDEQGVPIVARVGRFGAYLSRGEDTVSLPEDLAPDELTEHKARELLAAPSGDREVGVDPESGLVVYAKTGRFGAYVQLGEHDSGSKEKPKTSSLLKTQSPESITLEEALALLALPRLVGRDADGQEIFAQLGRYGPYISKQKDSRSLESEEQIFTVTVPEAQALFAQPRRRGGQRKAAEPLRELGNDPVSGGLITLREGRFGLYVTDGETNASLRKEDDPSTLTPERAQELLIYRREAGPSKKKKASKKKATQKKVAKKTAKPGDSASEKPAKKAARKVTKKAARKPTKKASKKPSVK